ncbi:MAG: hypothetical protein LZF86_110073 [Nitrospira sp.]|nr:MAG: hypothetical protein LZF86_110073 [Nitrospira sp.]
MEQVTVRWFGTHEFGEVFAVLQSEALTWLVQVRGLRGSDRLGGGVFPDVRSRMCSC